MCDGNALNITTRFAECLFVNSSARTSKECSCKLLCTGTNKWVSSPQYDSCRASHISDSLCNPSSFNNTFSPQLDNNYIGWYCNSTINEVFKRHCVLNSSPDLCAELQPSDYAADPTALGIIISLSIAIIMIAIYFCYQSTHAIHNDKTLLHDKSLSDGPSSSNRKLKSTHNSKALDLRSESHSGRKLVKNDSLSGRNLLGIGRFQRKKKSKDALPMRKLSSWFRMNADQPRPKESDNSIPEPEVLNVSGKFKQTGMKQSSSRSLSDYQERYGASDNTQLGIPGAISELSSEPSPSMDEDDEGNDHIDAGNNENSKNECYDEKTTLVEANEQHVNIEKNRECESGIASTDISIRAEEGIGIDKHELSR